MCNHNYALGTTRRCLEDGHHFCSGTTVVIKRRTNGKPRFKRHKACTSEFDYQGWKRWSNWRRGEFGYTIIHSGASTPDSAIFVSPPRSSRPHKDCWNRCDYPSECRWGGESTPVSRNETPVVSTETSTLSVSPAEPAPVTFDSIVGPSGPLPTEEQPTAENAPLRSPTRNALGTEFWQSILRATRGRRATDPDPSNPSPLRLHPVQEEEEEDGDASPITTPNSSPTEEEMTEEFVDAMDVDVVENGAEGELQMPAIPLRRFGRLDEDLDSDDESMDEEVAAIARYEDVDLNLDPRLRD